MCTYTYTYTWNCAAYCIREIHTGHKYIHTGIYMYINIHMYKYRERERQRERKRGRALVINSRPVWFRELARVVGTTGSGPHAPRGIVSVVDWSTSGVLSCREYRGSPGI